jgi:hypothetical protein
MVEIIKYLYTADILVDVWIGTYRTEVKEFIETESSQRIKNL